MAGSTVLDGLRRALGRRVERCARIVYVVADEEPANDGPLELGFVGGEVLLLDGASDGESLRISNEPWRDPFTEPLSAENREFVASHGAWRRQDVSSRWPYSSLVGKAVADLVLLQNQFGRVAGVRILFEGGDLWFYVAGDEARVAWGPTSELVGWSQSAIE